MACDATSVLSALQAGATESSDPERLGDLVVRAMRTALPQASWVGIYWLRGRTLELGPYDGPATSHERIPVGRGLCGTAVAEDRDLRVADVREETDYLACSPAVRSELVVLIRSHGRVVGQLDLDAESVGAFDEDDHCVVRTVADSFGALIEPSFGSAVEDAPAGS